MSWAIPEEALAWVALRTLDYRKAKEAMVYQAGEPAQMGACSNFSTGL